MACGAKQKGPRKMFKTKKSDEAIAPKRIAWRLIALLVAVSAMLVTMPFAVPAKDVTYDDVKNSESEVLLKRLNELTSASNELSTKINDAEKSKADALACKELYDSMHYIYTEQLDLLMSQRTALEEELENCRKEAETLEAEYEQSYENFRGLLRMTYEEGSASYIAILLGAEDLGDLLARIERVSGMIGYNTRLMKRVDDARVELDEKKAEIEASRAKVDEAAAKVNAKEAELEELDDKNAALLVELEARIKEDKAAADKLKEEQEAANKEFDDLVARMIAEEEERQRQIEEELRRQELEEERRRQLEAEKELQDALERENNNSEYIWPLPTQYNRITSWFNEDRNLTEIGYKDTHGGMDIAAPNKTPIYAVKTGRVILAGVVSGYGNCVMIDHGNNVVSIYGHASRLLVKKGDIVTKGQTIALVGLTGITTGYHLHIEFRKNGRRVEPLDYISIPKS